jgi:hypothetical protein
MDSDFEESIREVQEGARKPRVTHLDLEAKIAREHYFTAAEGVIGAMVSDIKHGESLPEAIDVDDRLKVMTFCVLVLKNGFMVTGQSSCVSDDHFDAHLGRVIARKNAVDAMWPLVGYQAREDASKCCP